MSNQKNLNDLEKGDDKPSTSQKSNIDFQTLLMIQEEMHAMKEDSRRERSTDTITPVRQDHEDENENNVVEEPGRTRSGARYTKPGLMSIPGMLRRSPRRPMTTKKEEANQHPTAPSAPPLEMDDPDDISIVPRPPRIVTDRDGTNVGDIVNEDRNIRQTLKNNINDEPEDTDEETRVSVNDFEGSDEDHDVEENESNVDDDINSDSDEDKIPLGEFGLHDGPSLNQEEIKEFGGLTNALLHDPENMTQQQIVRMKHLSNKTRPAKPVKKEAEKQRQKRTENKETTGTMVIMDILTTQKYLANHQHDKILKSEEKITKLERATENLGETVRQTQNQVTRLDEKMDNSLETYLDAVETLKEMIGHKGKGENLSHYRTESLKNSPKKDCANDNLWNHDQEVDPDESLHVTSGMEQSDANNKGTTEAEKARYMRQNLVMWPIDKVETKWKEDRGDVRCIVWTKNVPKELNQALANLKTEGSQELNSAQTREVLKTIATHAERQRMSGETIMAVVRGQMKGKAKEFIDNLREVDTPFHRIWYQIQQNAGKPQSQVEAARELGEMLNHPTGISLREVNAKILSLTKIKKGSVGNSIRDKLSHIKLCIETLHEFLQLNLKSPTTLVSVQRLFDNTITEVNKMEVGHKAMDNGIYLRFYEEIQELPGMANITFTTGRRVSGMMSTDPPPYGPIRKEVTFTDTKKETAPLSSMEGQHNLGFFRPQNVPRLNQTPFAGNGQPGQREVHGGPPQPFPRNNRGQNIPQNTYNGDNPNPRQERTPYTTSYGNVNGFNPNRRETYASPTGQGQGGAFGNQRSTPRGNDTSAWSDLPYDAKATLMPEYYHNRCWNCGRVGHAFGDCRTYQGMVTNDPRTNPACTKCKGYHTRQNCHLDDRTPYNVSSFHRPTGNEGDRTRMGQGQTFNRGFDGR